MTEAFFIHYSESPEPTSAATIDSWHEGRGFPAEGSNPLKHIGYHWVIHRDGSIEPGRSDDVRPIHCPGWNYLGVIAVCCIGTDREPDYPSQAQYQAVASFIRDYQPRQVWLHKEQHPTSCPGRFDKDYCLSLVGQTPPPVEEEDEVIPFTRLADEKGQGEFAGKTVASYKAYGKGSEWLHLCITEAVGSSFMVFVNVRQPEKRYFNIMQPNDGYYGLVTPLWALGMDQEEYAWIGIHIPVEKAPKFTGFIKK